jgi:hypothetical protein
LLSAIGLELLEEEKVIIDDENEEVTICSIEELMKKFYQLKKEKLYHTKIGYLKSQKIDELRNVRYKNS